MTVYEETLKIAYEDTLETTDNWVRDDTFLRGYLELKDMSEELFEKVMALTLTESDLKPENQNRQNSRDIVRHIMNCYRDTWFKEINL